MLVQVYIARYAAPLSLYWGAAPLLVLPRVMGVKQSSVAAAGRQVYFFVLLRQPPAPLFALFSGCRHSGVSQYLTLCILQTPKKRKSHLIGGLWWGAGGVCGGGWRRAPPSLRSPLSSASLCSPWALCRVLRAGLAGVGGPPAPRVAAVGVSVWRVCFLCFLCFLCGVLFVVWLTLFFCLFCGVFVVSSFFFWCALYLLYFQVLGWRSTWNRY